MWLRQSMYSTAAFLILLPQNIAHKHEVSLTLGQGYPHPCYLLNNEQELLDFGDDVSVLVFRECLHGLGTDVTPFSCA